MNHCHRNRMLVRALKLAKALEAHRYMPHVDVLAKELACHKRTVYRDLAALEEAHWPMPARPAIDLLDEDAQPRGGVQWYQRGGLR